MEPQINASIQVVPINNPEAIPFIDRAIDLIRQSGLEYEVGPFSTSVEGSLPDFLNLTQKIRSAVHEAGLEEVLINIQIHSHAQTHVRAKDKTQAHRP